MTQLEHGTKVLYGCYPNEDADHDMRTEAFIRGHTILENRLYYVLSIAEEDTHFFIRPHDWVTKTTSLPQYIGDYIGLELERSTVVFNIALTGRMAQLRHWIEEAIDAYEGGAR